MNAPILLFAYARPEHTRLTIESLLQNPQARESDLIVFSDGPRVGSEESVSQVRDLLSKITGFGSVEIHERETNYGLSNSVISGVTEVLRRYESVIVLEDDMVTSRFFLQYMNEALKKFQSDPRVISIHGYLPALKGDVPEAFFLPGADCWGWGTWRRGWKIFNPDGDYLLHELRIRRLTSAFDVNDSYPYTDMLRGQIAGENDSWAIRWHASAYLSGGLTLHPGRSLIRNIGNDSSGTHCAESTSFDVEPSSSPIDLSGLDVAVSNAALLELERFYMSLNAKNSGTLQRRLKRLLGVNQK